MRARSSASGARGPDRDRCRRKARRPMTFDLVVRGGTVVTAADAVRADIGIADGRIVALAENLPAE
ncbi:MAG: hypothetical protein NZM07_10635, partial [Elioraea sp.]|nr:hypothetical protein [Elioraea sp.]